MPVAGNPASCVVGLCRSGLGAIVGTDVSRWPVQQEQVRERLQYRLLVLSAFASDGETFPRVLVDDGQLAARSIVGVVPGGRSILDGDEAVLKTALAEVIRSRGVAADARKAGINRVTLYQLRSLIPSRRSGRCMLCSGPATSACRYGRHNRAA